MVSVNENTLPWVYADGVVQLEPRFWSPTFFIGALVWYVFGHP
jgi:hypothetical protein